MAWHRINFNLSLVIHLTAVAPRMPKLLFCIMSSRIKFAKLLPHLQVASSRIKFAILLPHLQVASELKSLVQDCSNSIANALELLQYCTKPSI